MTGENGHPDDAVQLDAKSEPGRLVVLTPNDEDRFVRDCEWVVQASKIGIGLEVWLRELHALLRHIHNWAKNRKDRIARIFAAPRDDQIAIYVVPTSPQYDVELADELTELDLELAEKFQNCQCDALQVPESRSDTLLAQAGVDRAILVYGEVAGAQSEVDT